MAKNLVRCISTFHKKERITFIPKHLTEDAKFMQKMKLHVHEPVKFEEIGAKAIKPQEEIETFVEEAQEEIVQAPKKQGRPAKS